MTPVVADRASAGPSWNWAPGQLKAPGIVSCGQIWAALGSLPTEALRCKLVLGLGTFP